MWRHLGNSPVSNIMLILSVFIELRRAVDKTYLLQQRTYVTPFSRLKLHTHALAAVFRLVGVVAESACCVSNVRSSVPLSARISATSTGRISLKCDYVL